MMRTQSMGQVMENIMIKFDYIKNPKDIYALSFERLKTESNLQDLPEDLHAIAMRMVHATGNPNLINTMAYSDAVHKTGFDALQQGKPILCDAQMVAHGIIERMLPANNKIICTLNDEKVPQIAQDLGTTRSAAAVELWHDHLEGAIVAIGNAPTTLFYLLEKIINDGWPKPALIIGCPIGYVGATESKEALIQYAGNIQYITVRGRMGGSAMTASAVNALGGANDLKRWG